MDTHPKMFENTMLRGYLVSNLHKNKIPTVIPMLSGLIFLVAITFTSLGVAVTPGINMADKKSGSSFSLASVAHRPAM